MSRLAWIVLFAGCAPSAASTDSAAPASPSRAPAAVSAARDLALDGGACLPCDRPPASTCLDVATRESFVRAGACDAGCRFAPLVEACPLGCHDGACDAPATPAPAPTAAPTCAQSCDAPPAPTCLDAATLRTPLAGVCWAQSLPGGGYGAGVCRFPTLDRACARGCVNGACAACAPSCAGRACGDDGCGGSCGACGGGTLCSGGACVAIPPLGCGDLGGLEPGAPWPMMRACPGRQSRSAFVGAQHALVRWVLDLAPYRLIAPPLVAADGTLYAGDRALAPDGTPRWQIGASGHAIWIDLIGRGGALYGGEEWQANFNVVAFDAGGARLWSSAAVVWAPLAAAGDGTLLAPVRDAQAVSIAAFAPDGAAKWRADLDAAQAWGPRAPALAPDGSLYAAVSGAQAAHLFALAPGGAEAWRDDGAFGDAAVAPDGTVYHDGPELAARDPSGRLRWSFPGAGAATTAGDGRPPAVAADGTVYVPAAQSPVFYAVRPDGTLAWSAPVRAAASASIGGDGTLYVAAAGDGATPATLYALDPADGHARFTLALCDGAPLQPVIGLDQLVYVACGTRLYAVGP